MDKHNENGILLVQREVVECCIEVGEMKKETELVHINEVTNGIIEVYTTSLKGVRNGIRKHSRKNQKIRQKKF